MLLRITKFGSVFSPRLFSPVLAGLALAAAYHESASAAPEAQRAVYVISDHEGYGLVECISQKRECGKIVADSWCEAHGHGRAVSFGSADDLTAAIDKSGRKSEGAVVSCAD